MPEYCKIDTDGHSGPHGQPSAGERLEGALTETASQHHLAELRTLPIGQVQEFHADSVRQTVSYDSHADDVVYQRGPQLEHDR